MFANSNITMGGTNATADDEFFQALNETAFENLAIMNSTSDLSKSPYPSDTDFISIRDLSGNDELDADADGNVYYAAPGNGTPLAVISNIVEGDAGGRFFHYYTDVMAKYNVSRLRLSKEQYIPLTSDVVGFVPVNYNNDNTTSDVYVAADTVNNIFFPITCDIENQPSKAFLATDIAAGSKTLMDPSLRNTVTGGIVEKCYFLPWAAPAGSGIDVPTPADPSPVFPLSVSGVDPSITLASVSASIGAPIPVDTGAPAAVTLTGAPGAGPSAGAAEGTSSGEVTPTGAAIAVTSGGAAAASSGAA